MKPIFRSSKTLLICLSLWLLISVFIRPMSVPDEGRYGDISRWMYESGDWLIPRLNGIPFMHKPPLLHWLTASLMEIFGSHVWVARLVPAFAGIIMLVSLFVFTKKHVNERIAQISTAILATGLLFYGCAEYINHDILVASWISLTVFCFADFILSGKRNILFLGYFACACAFLSKGLIGVLIPGMVILPWMIYIGQWKKIPAVLNPFGLLLFALIALPWVFIVQQHYPNFLHYFFIEQQFSRFNSGEFNNKQGWYFYAALLFVNFLPIILANGFKFSSTAIRAQTTQPIFSLLVWWALSVLLFFSIPPSKLAGYILPSIAPFTMIFALITNRIIEENKLSKFQVYVLPTLLFVLASSLVVAPFTMHRDIGFYSAEKNQIFAVAGIVMILCGILIVLFKKHKIDFFTFIVACMMLLCSMASSSVQFFDVKSNSNQVSFVQDIPKNLPIIFYDNYFYDVPLLLNLKNPVYVVKDWSKVNTDSSSLELKDGLLFEANKAQYLWKFSQFNQAIKSKQKLVVFAKAGDLKLDKLQNQYHVQHSRNFDIFIIN